MSYKETPSRTLQNAKTAQNHKITFLKSNIHFAVTPSVRERDAVAAPGVRKRMASSDAAVSGRWRKKMDVTVGNQKRDVVAR